MTHLRTMGRLRPTESPDRQTFKYSSVRLPLTARCTQITIINNVHQLHLQSCLLFVFAFLCSFKGGFTPLPLNGCRRGAKMLKGSKCQKSSSSQRSANEEEKTQFQEPPTYESKQHRPRWMSEKAQSPDVAQTSKRNFDRVRMQLRMSREADSLLTYALGESERQSERCFPTPESRHDDSLSEIFFTAMLKIHQEFVWFHSNSLLIYSQIRLPHKCNT